jgi:hypothetical protein
MNEGCYGFQRMWRNLPEYLQNLDVAMMRKEAGQDRRQGGGLFERRALHGPGI